MEFPIRINKYLRDSGLASRREADKLVQAGLVFVNGKRAEPGQMVQAGQKVTLKENKNNKKVLKYLAYYKPRGLATQDLAGKISVISELAKAGKKPDKSQRHFDGPATILPKADLAGVYPIGRLDKESEGLLLLTNDGRFARQVLDNYEKEYHVSVREDLKNDVAKIIGRGMNSRALGQLLPAKARLINKHKISIILREGKRHQIRIMLEELGFTVNSLKRVRIGSVKLGALKPGDSRLLSAKM